MLSPPGGAIARMCPLQYGMTIVEAAAFATPTVVKSLHVAPAAAVVGAASASAAAPATTAAAATAAAVADAVPVFSVAPCGPTGSTAASSGSAGGAVPPAPAATAVGYLRMAVATPGSASAATGGGSAPGSDMKSVARSCLRHSALRFPTVGACDLLGDPMRAAEIGDADGAGAPHPMCVGLDWAAPPPRVAAELAAFLRARAGMERVGRAARAAALSWAEADSAAALLAIWQEAAGGRA